MTPPSRRGPEELPPAYGALEARFQRLSHLEGAGAVLGWDWATMMPEGGAETRAAQIATLEVMGHEILTDPALAELVARAEEELASFGPWERANLREMRRKIKRAQALPAELVEAYTKARGRCEMRWRRARAEDDFAGFAEAFEPLLARVRELGAALGDALGLSPFDALIDSHEPGIKVETIDTLFDELGRFLPGFVDEVLEHQAKGPKPLPLEGTFPIEAQRALAHRLMEALGFDFDSGRLDVSEHPFCGGTPSDVRITTRYDEKNFAPALMAVLHETGHALFELGLPRAWLDQPVGAAPGMGLHESQSLLVEMQVCRGSEFIRFVQPLIKEAFAPHTDVSGRAWEAANLERHYRTVARSLIRVDADEVTYPLHVMLRYRLEKAMLAGDLKVADLPGAWVEGMAEFLGIRPRTDQEGCLQDIHWAVGLFGYFPSYTLGAVAAAQLYDAATRDEPELPERIAQGDFRPLLEWLRKKIHGFGSFHSSAELIRAASGRPLDAAFFKAHLKKRYLT
ncbi:MAG: carboxypeptidase M32 [Alphaproteobacteria bacterium]